jgi:hypothetical protein
MEKRYCKSVRLRPIEALSKGTSGTMIETPKGDRLLMAAKSQRETIDEESGNESPY